MGDKRVRDRRVSDTARAGMTCICICLSSSIRAARCIALVCRCSSAEGGEARCCHASTLARTWPDAQYRHSAPTAVPRCLQACAPMRERRVAVQELGGVGASETCGGHAQRRT